MLNVSRIEHAGHSTRSIINPGDIRHPFNKGKVNLPSIGLNKSTLALGDWTRMTSSGSRFGVKLGLAGIFLTEVDAAVQEQ